MKRDIVLDKEMKLELEKIEHAIKENGLGLTVANGNKFLDVFKKLFSEKTTVIICATDGVKQDEIDAIKKNHEKCIYKSIRNKDKKPSVWQYVILISADIEYGFEEKKEIDNIHAMGGRVFPFLVFPDRILLPDSEISYVNSVREAVQSCTSFTAALSISKNLKNNSAVYLRILFDIIHCYYLLDRLGNILEDEKRLVSKMVSSYCAERYSDWERIEYVWTIEGHEKLIQSCTYISSKIGGIINQLKNIYFRYAEKCRCELIEERFSVKNVSDFAADLLSKYGLVQEKTNGFLAKLIDKYSDVFDYQALEEIKMSKRELEKSPEVAFVGGFSSGKTSFINWVLDMSGGHELRTSGGHNTAILTYIKSAEDIESVETVYKRGKGSFKWKLFYVSEAKGGDIYSGPDNARVVKIDTFNGRIIFDYFGDRFSQVLNYSEYGVTVKRGDLVKRGDKLTKTSYSEENALLEKMNVTLRPEDEYQNILDSIKKQKLTDVEVTVRYMSVSNRIRHLETVSLRGNDAVKMITRIRKLHSKIDCENIRLSEISEKFWKIDYLPALMFFTNVDISATCNINDLTEELDEKTWKKYSGNTDSGLVSFSETPAGYLYTDYMSYRLNKGFLKYVEIVDTPGLGSISDEHDAITERYIRGAVDTLLVMIRIDRQSVQESRRKFIFNIAEIFEKSHRNKNNVFFVCNIWSAVFQGKAEKEVSKKYCDEYFSLIQEAGFLKENFYVIDMRKMQMGERREKFFDYPSDIPFRSSFLMNVSNLGICNSLKKTATSVAKVLAESEKRLKNRSLELRTNKNYRIDRIEKLKKAKQKLMSISMRDFDELFPDETYKDLNELAIDIESRTSVMDWKKEQNLLIDTVSGIENLMNDNFEKVEVADGSELDYDEIYQEFVLRNSKMDTIIFDLYQQGVNKYKGIPAVVGIRSFPFLSLKQMINKHYSNYQSWIHFVKNRQHSESGAEEISSFIFDELKKCFDENKKNYESLQKRVLEKRKAYISEIEKDISILSQEDDTTENEMLSFKLENLGIIKKSWENDIVPKLKEAEIIA